MKKKIPLNKLRDIKGSWLLIQHITHGNPLPVEEVSLMAHRDDHYLFFLSMRGCCSIFVDFQEIKINHGVLYYIMPTQVHHRIGEIEREGWFIEADAAFIPMSCRSIFENKLNRHIPSKLKPFALNNFSKYLA